MEREKLKRVVEALLFITDNPLTLKKLREITEESGESIVEIINEIGEDLNEKQSAMFVKEVAGGFQMATRAEFGEWVKKLYIDKIKYRLSKSALETLSIIAYKQPITRGEIEEVRGVDAAGVLENLLEKKLVRVCGRKETLGRPLLYGTTNEFLKYFGLKNISEIPSIDELVPPEPEKDSEMGLEAEELTLPLNTESETLKTTAEIDDTQDSYQNAEEIVKEES
ncbi:MAG: SMC-Scp complex subunit ScpB [bacterium]